MSKVTPRHVSPIVAKIRDLLLGRSSIDHNRFADFIAKRTQPPPDLPAGSSSKLYANHYCLRDGRREAQPPLLLAKNTKAKQLVASSAVSESIPATERVPGVIFNY